MQGGPFGVHPAVGRGPFGGDPAVGRSQFLVNIQMGREPFVVQPAWDLNSVRFYLGPGHLVPSGILNSTLCSKGHLGAKSFCFTQHL
jgi:hypothetical protein